MILFGASVVLSAGMLSAQSKHEKVVYHDSNVQSGDLILKGEDAVSTAEYLKFKIKVDNKSNDIIIYKPEASTVKVNGKDFTPKEKWISVKPIDSDHRVVDIKANGMRENEFTFQVEGLYKVNPDNNPIPAEDFQLPASQNGFKAGNFSCNMLDLKKETDETKVKFECVYTGDKIGIIHTNRAAVRLPDGTEIANNRVKAGYEVLQKGDSQKFSLVWKRMEGGKATDMQKIKLMIVWRNTFVESEAVKIPGGTLNFKIDEAKSK